MIRIHCLLYVYYLPGALSWIERARRLCLVGHSTLIRSRVCYTNCSALTLCRVCHMKSFELFVSVSLEVDPHWSSGGDVRGQYFTANPGYQRGITFVPLPYWQPVVWTVFFLFQSKLVESQSNVIPETQINDPHTLQAVWIVLWMVWRLYDSRYSR